MVSYFLPLIHDPNNFFFSPFFFFWNFWIPYSRLIRAFFGSVPRRTGSSLQRTTPRSRSTSAISMRTASTPASSPPSLSAVSSVLRSLFFLHSFFSLLIFLFAYRLVIYSFWNYYLFCLFKLPEQRGKKKRDRV